MLTNLAILNYSLNDFCVDMLADILNCGEMDLERCLKILNEIKDKNLFWELTDEIKNEINCEYVDPVGILYRIVLNNALNELDEILDETIQNYLDGLRPQVEEKVKNNIINEIETVKKEIQKLEKSIKEGKVKSYVDTEEKLNELQEELEELEDKFKYDLEDLINDELQNIEENIWDDYNWAKKNIYAYCNFIDSQYDCSTDLKEFLEKINFKENAPTFSTLLKWFISEL